VSEEQGVVIARVHRELIWVKTDRGVTTTLRVTPEVGAKLDLGQRATVSFDERGRPTGVTAVKR
jgi:hypothetical protein